MAEFGHNIVKLSSYLVFVIVNNGKEFCNFYKFCYKSNKHIRGGGTFNALQNSNSNSENPKNQN